MPELPDLENFSRNLTKIIVGKKVEKIAVVNDTKLKVPASQLKKSLEGEKVQEVYREGKELHMKFSNGRVLGLHLMLHGNLNLFEGKNDKKYPIIEMFFDDDSGLALSDYQGAATPTLDPEEKKAPGWSYQDPCHRRVWLGHARHPFRSARPARGAREYAGSPGGRRRSSARYRCRHCG